MTAVPTEAGRADASAVARVHAGLARVRGRADRAGARAAAAVAVDGAGLTRAAAALAPLAHAVPGVAAIVHVSAALTHGPTADLGARAAVAVEVREAAAFADIVAGLADVEAAEALRTAGRGVEALPRHRATITDLGTADATFTAALRAFDVAGAASPDGKRGVAEIRRSEADIGAAAVGVRRAGLGGGDATGRALAHA